MWTLVNTEQKNLLRWNIKPNFNILLLVCLKSSLLCVPPDGIALKLCMTVSSKLHITFEIFQHLSQSERIRRPLGKCTNL